MPIASANSSFTSMARSTIPTDVDYSSAISAVLEDSENEVMGVIDGNRVSERPASSRGMRAMTKRVALGVLDSNARRSPRSKKGNNSRYDCSEWVL
jgi:hypothetical protein